MQQKQYSLTQLDSDILAICPIEADENLLYIFCFDISISFVIKSGLLPIFSLTFFKKLSIKSPFLLFPNNNINML